MDEILEAERFSEQLDRILAGAAPAAGLPEELRLDLVFAARLAGSDLSAESRVRESLESALTGGTVRLRGLPLFGLRWKALAAFAAAAAVLAPGAFYWMSSPEVQSGLEAGFDRRGSMFADGGAPYEDGLSGIAPGGLLGQDTPVITPLNVRDPSALIVGPGGAPEAASPEGYAYQAEGGFHKAAERGLSTFSIDVDRASYANARRFLNGGQLPPASAVRVEEFINYFPYRYPEPKEGPFSITTEAVDCPWKPGHRLVRIGLRARTVKPKKLPPSNLVFLIDSSGSMADEDKLPLLKKAFGLLVGKLRKQDRVAIVTYAGGAGLVLPPTRGDDREAILGALERLDAGGSTAGGAGIELAYRVAAENFLKDGNNRVLLASDGDFNVGVASEGELARLIEEKRKTGIFLTVLGFGTGNIQDAKMELLADKGDGNYAYIDGLAEAEKVLVQEVTGTLLAVAKDVKVQVEFNPARAQAYRLIGYENRALKAEEFHDDKKDAGELGAGHAVTALYEVIPEGVKAELPRSDELRYKKTGLSEAAIASGELLTVKVRFKKPAGGKSELLEFPVSDVSRPWAAASEDLRFAAAAAGFGMLLRRSEFAGDLTYAKVAGMARGALGKDPGGARAEMAGLIDKARAMSGSEAALEGASMWTVPFAKGTLNITAEGEGKLEKAAETLVYYPLDGLQLVGLAGRAEVDAEKLASGRAERVGEELANRYGIDPKRIQRRHRIVDNGEQGVEIYVMPAK